MLTENKNCSVQDKNILSWRCISSRLPNTFVFAKENYLKASALLFTCYLLVLRLAESHCFTNNDSCKKLPTTPLRYQKLFVPYHVADTSYTK